MTSGRRLCVAVQMHSSYYRYMASSNFYCDFLDGKIFTWFLEIFEFLFYSKPIEYYSRGIYKLENYLEQVIDNDGKYIEVLQILLFNACIEKFTFQYMQRYNKYYFLRHGLLCTTWTHFLMFWLNKLKIISVLKSIFQVAWM